MPIKIINNKKIEIIINYLQENEYITAKLVKKIKGVSDSRAKQYLRILLKEGYLIPEGSNRNRRYKRNK